MGRRTYLLLPVLLALLVVPVWALNTPAKGSTFVGALLALAALPAAWILGRFRALTPRGLSVLVGVALAAGLLSLLTGRWNGLTDEPYTQPQYYALFPDLYGHPAAGLSYVQYGRSVTIDSSYFVYLPLVPVLFVPGVPYRAVALAAWLGTVVLLRHRPFAAASYGTPYVAVLASNGFNDPMAILFLTAGFAVAAGTTSAAARAVSLATKQFCVAFAVLYYALRREWRWAAASLAIFGLVLLPFAVQAPGGTFCHAVLASPAPCGGPGSVLAPRILLSHLNYWLYPLWAGAVFGPGTVAWLRSPATAAARDRARRALGAAGSDASLSELGLLLGTLGVVIARRLRDPRSWWR